MWLEPGVSPKHGTKSKTSRSTKRRQEQLRHSENRRDEPFHRSKGRLTRTRWDQSGWGRSSQWRGNGKDRKWHQTHEEGTAFLCRYYVVTVLKVWLGWSIKRLFGRKRSDFHCKTANQPKQVVWRKMLSRSPATNRVQKFKQPGSVVGSL